MNSDSGSNLIPKVSVIVPVYKVDRYLTQCLNSIVNQTLKEIEIIIVDEGDQDRCREIIDYYESVDPRVVAPHQKNGGYGASCNLGISMAKGEYMAFVESDDSIEPEMLEEMYEYAKSLGADVVKTPYSEYYSDGEKYDCSYRTIMAEECPQGKLFSMKQFGRMLSIHASLWSGLYRTEYMREKGIKFIEAKGAAYVDVGFRIDTLINTDKIAWLDKPYYNYRVDAIGSSTNNFKLLPMAQRWNEAHKKFEEMKDDYVKYYGPWLIIDEYLNTVAYFSSRKVTEEEIKIISENMEYVPEEVIINSPVLNERTKSNLLAFKKNPKGYVKKRSMYVSFSHGIRKKEKRSREYDSNFYIDKLSDNGMSISLMIGTLTSFIGLKATTEFIPNYISIPSIVPDLFWFSTLAFIVGTAFCYCFKIAGKARNVLRMARFEYNNKKR